MDTHFEKGCDSGCAHWPLPPTRTIFRGCLSDILAVLVNILESIY
jgi:hypothetical protein